MTKLFCTTLFIFSISILFGQIDLPEFQIEETEVEGHLRFLASDALKGRRTGESGNNIAASYIAEYFRSYGVKSLASDNSYFQPVGFEAIQPPKSGKLILNKKEYVQGNNLLITSGDPITLNKGKAVFAGHGWIDDEAGHNDYKNLDVKGKIVIVLPGTPKGDDNQTVFRSMKSKQKFAREHGAVAIFELYRLGSFPWDFFKSYFGKESLRLADKDQSATPSTNIVYGWIKEADKEEMAQNQSTKQLKASLESSGFVKRTVISNNVAGWIEGSDPELKNEYVMLSAHYDHVGTGKNGGGAFTEKDSIFNGARDNAVGVVSLLSAAKAMAIQPPKRSVILLAVTAEEIGLLGSAYYAQYPLVPLSKTIFNLNVDGAGYNDKSIISIIGFGRTGTDAAVKKGVNSVGLEVFPDPAPEQGLFDRSDNVSFAEKGVPALTYTPGFRSFDAEIAKYYHQVSDEADSIDFNYILKFCQSFTYTARLIGDNYDKPFWVSGDKYEKAGKTLYNR